MKHSFTTALALLTVTGLLQAAPASALTKYQGNLIAASSDCLSGPGYCLNVDGFCGFDNSDCALGTISSRSKVKLDGKFKLKASILGVTDVAGALLTTGPAETDDGNLILKVSFSACPVDTGAPPICDDVTHNVYLKAVLTNGRAVVSGDLSLVFTGFPTGSPLTVLGVSLLGAPVDGTCTGDNSAAGIASRLNMAACESSGFTAVVRGTTGIVTP